ncbi:PI-stichotoxin-She2a-like [Achroia grisella]|uniref:PI-stichotoxin-She2a-like n=1 Tax=Achroia grisella TaxID=688607 RepID=UPI0027D24631|nr:PI-stichotoxin-She2a-like [Achroia grisella]
MGSVVYLFLFAAAMLSFTMAEETDRCSLRIQRGLCYASFERFGYDADTGKCESFIYGGCGGNNNNFRTLEECRERCEGTSQ